MAVDIKRQVEALHPHYKYNPRKSSEIRRRAKGNNGVYNVESASSETAQNSITAQDSNISIALASLPTPPLDFDTASIGSLASPPSEM